MARNKKQEADSIERALEMVANTTEGLRVLRLVYGLSGYGGDVKCINHNTGELNAQSTLNNLAKRDVWLKIRERLSPQLRALIENQEDDL